MAAQGQGNRMQDHGQIARAFAAWQRSHQKLCDAEERLAAATLAWQQGLQPQPDNLRQEVEGLKAEQDWRYDVAAEALRNRRNTGAVPVAVSPTPRPGLASGRSPQSA
jgi:hypothetical protein